MNAEEIARMNDYNRTERAIAQSETIGGLAAKVEELRGIIRAAHKELVLAMDTNESMFVDSARAMLKDALEP
jgi:hypothetical protein